MGKGDDSRDMLLFTNRELQTESIINSSINASQRLMRVNSQTHCMTNTFFTNGRMTV